MTTARQCRRGKLRRLATESFDLAVIGGGINGAGIAREAALRGIRTVLVDKGDFASGTSSRSTKLIHGGVRYLEHGEIGLVLESSRERDLLRRKLAPHLVRPMPFFFPVYRSGPMGYWKLRAGLVAYDLLAGLRNIRRHRGCRGARARAMEPKLLAEGLVGGALYYDCATDDARLVLETVLAAEAAGALCLNYVSVEGFGKTGNRISDVTMKDRLDEGAALTVPVGRVVNATGPWLDAIRRLDDPGAAGRIRPTKGAHVVVPRERVGNRHAVVLRAVSDGRVLFVIPWEEQTVIGTTDTDFHGSPDHVVVETEEVEYLLETVNHHFPDARLGFADVVSAWAGLRALVSPPGDPSPSEISREEEIFESPSGLVSLGGGKLTTYRRVSIRVVDRVVAGGPPDWAARVLPRSGTEREPLPGAVVRAGEPLDRVGLDAGELEALRGRHGYYAAEIARAISARPELGERLVTALPDLAAEALWGAACEMAVRVEDVLRRRTQIALRDREAGLGAAPRVAREMAGPLEWDDETVQREGERYRDVAELPPEPGPEEERREA